MGAEREWLETDGRGGFASGPAIGPRTRRYHGLLLAATLPPTARVLLVNGVEAWVQTPGGPVALSSHRFGDHIHPDGHERIESFTTDPWPTWQFKLPDGSRLAHEVFVPHDHSLVVLSWKLLDAPKKFRLVVRPLISGRDPHALHIENPMFRFGAEQHAFQVAWEPYVDMPSIIAASTGKYHHEPVWFRQFLYAEELARGMDHIEDLASPGFFSFEFARDEALLVFAADGDGMPEDETADLRAIVENWRADERARRKRFATPLDRAADAYIVRRQTGKTIVAGYPWFTDWGRDTFIAMRGLCLATGRLDDAREILLQWAGEVQHGMLPNRFPERGRHAEFNSVDASLWFIVAIHEFFQAMKSAGRDLSTADRRRLLAAMREILLGYLAGTKFGIRCADDGLLSAGEAGSQLTWMDAKVDNWVVTPRAGKPVEVQALWFNALKIAVALATEFAGTDAAVIPAVEAARFAEIVAKIDAHFVARFWAAEKGYLADVVDENGEAGAVDWAVRPNQIFAVGGLPFPLLTGAKAAAVVATVERDLLTPMGLRSLSSRDSHFVPRYEGDRLKRDGAYHQGTVWPYLIGPFVEAWLRVQTAGADAETIAAKKAAARERFLAPLLAHLECAGIGHISEIADGDPPHAPRGCPFQAWSVGEVLRLDRVILADDFTGRPSR